METDELLTKKCYRILNEPVLDNLNIKYNSSNSKLVLWNNYQIFVFGDTELECLEKIFIPEFQIHLLIASNNYLLCLDKNGNVHTTSLKFKSSSQKTLKMPFQPKDQSIEVCLRHKENHTLSLKYETDTYFLCFHRINIDFKLERKVILLCDNKHWPLRQHSNEKCLLTTCSISEENFKLLNKLFKSEETFSNDHDLIVLSVDKMNIYACLFSAKNSNDEIILVNLYNCPAEICSLEILDCGELYLLIGLTMGTILRLCLKDISKTPDIVHLNTALYKMTTVKNSLVYSDGTTMWKAENVFTDIKLTQFFVKNTYDFAKCGDEIICTTFNKLIYKFSTEDQNACLIPKNDEYYAAENLLNNSAYLNKLFEVIDENNELVMKLEREQHYLTALSLSKRQDVVHKAIESTVAVLETYQDASSKENILTEDIKDYLEPDTWMFLISISNSTIYDTLNSIFKHLLENIIFYVTLSTENKILKTTCIRMVEPLKTVHYLVPLKLTNEMEINTNIKIVLNIPGALDQKKSIMVLYKKDILLGPEHFIRTNQNTISSLKKSPESIEELVQQISEAQYGSIFDFTDLETEQEYTHYVKLPNEYKEIFKSNYCERIAKIMKQMSADEFLKSKKHLIFSVGNKKVKLKIYNDGISNSLLQVTSTNAKIALNIRNFFANLVNKE